VYADARYNTFNLGIPLCLQLYLKYKKKLYHCEAFDNEGFKLKNMLVTMNMFYKESQ